MLRLLANLEGRSIAFACRMMDGESCDYADELAAFFLEAGFKVPEPIKTSVNDLPGYLAIVSRGSVDDDLRTLLLDTFEAARIPARIESIDPATVGAWYDDVVHVLVGRK